MTIDEIKTLINEVAKAGIAGIKVSDKGFSLEIENIARAAAAENPPLAAAQPSNTADVYVVAETTPAAPQDTAGLVTSPIVGTFYSAPAPGEKPFAEVGKKVEKGDVLFIIESMKLLNEVLCEQSGTVAEIMVADASPLGFGQPVMRIV